MDGLRPMPKFQGGAGLVDGTLAALLNQERGLTLKGASFSPGITASSAVATSTLNDASSATLRIDARLPGPHGNKVRVKTTRRSGLEAGLFDLDAWFPDLANVVGVTTVDAATDEVRISGTAYAKGAGPFLIEASTVPGGATSTTLYWLGAGVSGIAQSYRLFAAQSAAISGLTGTSVNVSSSGVAVSLRPCLAEGFRQVSMFDAHARYVEKVVNEGRDGGPASEYIRVTDLDSTLADDRPTDQGPLVLGGTTGGEFAVTGLKRRDHIVGSINLTTGVCLGSDMLQAVDKDLAVVRATGFATSDKLVLLVKPY